MKRRACEYDYVEVMACPSGCLNGGGQLKAGDKQSQQQLLDQLDAIYHDPQVVHPSTALHMLSSFHTRLCVGAENSVILCSNTDLLRSDDDLLRHLIVKR